MTNPNNGATLEDCHSNFFALTDLCGIKWRRFVSDGLMGSGHGHHSFGPLDDPVLSSFARCLAADILCVWRKSPNTRNQQNQNQLGESPNDQFLPAAPPPVSSQYMQHPSGTGSSLQNPQSVQMHMQPHHIPSHLMSPHGGLNIGPGPAGHATPHHHANVPAPYSSGSGQPGTPHHSHGHGLPPQQQSASMHNQQQQYNNPSLNGPKELWIFWYGEDPDLSNLVSPQLVKAEPDQGSWENGLSYECRTLLFKALHNLIERCLLAREFVRIDKWFIQPCDDNHRIGLKAFPMQLSFSFEFFVHGESTVCMSVDVRQHPPVRRITKIHLTASQTQTMPVILAPYGLAGTLTGVGYRMTDPGTHKILEEWKHFYPVEAALKSSLYDTTLPTPTHSSPHPNSAASTSSSPPNASPASAPVGIQPVVEVRVGGVIMRYPSCYVLSTEMDEIPRVDTASPHPSTSNSRFNVANAPKSRPTVCSDSEAAAFPTGPSPNKPQGSVVALQEIDKVEGILPERVWQECILSASKPITEQNPASSSGPCSSTGANADSVGHWDFMDPTKKSTCTCSKCNSRSLSGTRGNQTSLGGNISTTNSQSTKSGGSTKVKKTSYHRRNPQQLSALSSWGNLWDLGDDCSASGSVLKSSDGQNVTSNQSSNNCRSNAMPGTPIGGPPSYKAGPGSIVPVGLGSDGGIGASPASVAPSPLAAPKSQPASVQQAEPAMPTLSPQPSNDKQPAATPDAAAPKSVSSLSNQVFSPSVGSGLDGAKGEVGESSGNNAVSNNEAQPHGNQNISNVGNNSTEGSNPPGQHLLSWTAKGLRRPILPSKEYEQQLAEEDRFQPSDVIYDYSVMQAWLNHPVKRMKTNEGRVKPTTYSWGLGMKRIPDVPPSILANGPHERPHGKRLSDPYDFDDDHHQGDMNKRKDALKDDSKSLFLAAESVNGCKTGPRDLFTSEGIKPSMIDLDQIFDNSDTSSDETFQAPTPPGSNKPAGTHEDSISTTIKARTGLTLRPEELSKMFPTPPSHEHNPISSPSGLQPETPSAVEGLVDNSRRTQDNYSTAGSPSDENAESRPESNLAFIRSSGAQSHGRNHNQDWSFVYKPSSVYKMLGSSKYAPLHVLPSQQLSPLHIPISCTYMPSWQTTTTTSTVAQPTTTSSQSASITPLINPHPPGMNPVHPIQAHLRPGLSPISPAPSAMRGPASDLGSPPSSNMYLTMRAGVSSQVAIPHTPQTGPSSVQSAHHAAFTPRGSEAHALVVNLSLSDSVINLFRDHNFDSCTMCVCNATVKVVGNIRGSEVGLYIPDPTPDEDPVRCNCGFSASVNRRLAHRAGLFYEDEYEITTAALASRALLPDEWYDRRKPSLLLLDSKYPDMAALNADKEGSLASSIVDAVPAFLLELLREQCLLSYDNNASKFSGEIVDHRYLEKMYNYLDYLDGNRAALMALEHGRTVMIEAKGALSRSAEDAMPLKGQTNIMHQWPYLWGRGPQSSQDVMQIMRMLLPLLQDAVHAKAWDAQFTVLGPLTWRQFHRLAGRGTDVRCEPQPIPSILIGSEKDFVALSPLAIKFWEKLSLEPYGYPRDCAYIVVSPDCDFVLSKVRTFFRELSTVYETCQLGKHNPITKVLRDGILRVGRSAATKLSAEPVDDWFTKLPDIPTAAVLRLYAQVCRHNLVPLLANVSLDQSLFDAPAASQPSRPSQERPTPSPKMPPPSSDGSINPSAQGPSTPKNEYENELPAKEVPIQESIDDDEREPPALVIYLIDPFGFAVDNKDVHRMANLGLLRCFASMLAVLPETIKNNITLQVVSLEDIISLGNSLFDCKLKNDQLRHLSLTVYSQCRRLVMHQNNVKSLTGFGPAAAAELFLKSKDEKKSGSYRLYTPPFVLAPTKEKVSEGVEWVAGMPGHAVGGMVSSGNGSTVGPGFSPTSSSVLYVAYCISEDHRWLLASATDERGELLETTIISIYVPNRSRRKKASARKHGLHRLMDFILGIMSTGVHPWRLVVGRLGRVGHGELESWSSLLSRKSLLRASNQLRDSCRQCGLQCPGDCPCVLSACLVSLEPDSCLRLMPDQFTPDERFGVNVGGGSSSTLSTPQDISCTHVMAFPTSATTQSSQTAFQAEHINPGEDDDLFLGMEGDDMGADEGISAGLDLGDIFGNWEDNAPGVQSPLGSPRRDSTSQPGSPGGVGASGRQSPGFQSSSQGRMGRGGESGDEFGTVLQQPLALGYYVSTAPAGQLPSWFWASCPQRSKEKGSAVFFKSALHLHSHSVLHNMDDLLQQQSLAKQHPLDSQLTADVLRFVLEGYNALSWLYFDPKTHDRQSCLPIHMQKLLQLYHTVSALV